MDRKQALKELEKAEIERRIRNFGGRIKDRGIQRPLRTEGPLKGTMASDEESSLQRGGRP